MVTVLVLVLSLDISDLGLAIGLDPSGLKSS